ncbi:MAG: hypothetical protein LBN93_08810 [Candidatus Symbiothrix sp.]|jgi:hypothetical protein|nr:hypothetical protein [Candidatus Symbiothrix sp.]
MKTTATKKESNMDRAIRKRIAEGKPLSTFAKHWLSEDRMTLEIVDMRAILK